jgi:hypothetical protein
LSAFSFWALDVFPFIAIIHITAPAFMPGLHTRDLGNKPGSENLGSWPRFDNGSYQKLENLHAVPHAWSATSLVAS